MLRPTALSHTPSLGTGFLGGVTAMLLASALIFLAPAAGLPFIDIPRLVGGIFTGNATAAFWLGFWLFFAGGAIVLPLLLKFGWSMLPGSDIGLLGALVKGLVFAAALWVISGLLLPLGGLLNQLDAPVLQRPGFFALSHGILGAVVLAIVHVCYGISLALIAAMGQGIVMLDTLGVEGHWPTKGKEEVIA